MSADEEHHEGKLQEVVEDEVASNPSGSLDMFTLIRKQMPEVGDLKQEEGKPGNSQRALRGFEDRLLPIERSDEGIQGKRSWESCIVSPNGISPVFLVIVGHAEGVVHT